MIFIIFFIVAVLSLFGFGQVMGARNRERNVSTSVYETLNAGREKAVSRFEELRNRYSSQGAKPERHWFGLRKKVKKRTLLDKILGRNR